MKPADALQRRKQERERLGAKVESLRQLYQPDQTTKKIQELALMDAKNSAGAKEDGETADASTLWRKDRLSMIQEEVQKFAPSKRAAAFNAINKVWENEMDRIGAYIKEKDSDWTV